MACCNHGPGNTPLIRINSLSDALGVEILGKAEVRASLVSRVGGMLSLDGETQYLNPGGSVKDRVALRSERVTRAWRLFLNHLHFSDR